MKRILVYGMSDNPGGVESYLFGMSERMKKYGIQFDFISDFPGIAYEKELKENGASVYYIPPKGKKLISHWIGFARVLLRHKEYDSVYFNILDAGAVFTILIPWLFRKKIIVHSHNGNTDKVWLHKFCKPFVSKIANRKMACSGLAAAYMFGKKEASKKKVLIVPNAIDAERYDFNEKIREEYRGKLELSDKLTVCHIGRMSAQKNPFRILEIFSSVYRKDKNAVLLYVGTGELKEKVKEYAGKLKCAGNIKFLGVRCDISEILQASDVFLLPSLYEGLPIVAVEAQAAGLPVILSAAVTRETDITGNVRFIDLRRSDDDWAEEILRSRKLLRKSMRDRIISAGYDMNKPLYDEEIAGCFL